MNATRTRTLAAVFAFLLGMGFVQGQPYRFPDPTRAWTFPEHDLVELQAEVLAGELQLTLRYAGRLGLTDGNHGTVFIDGDRNPDTGGPLGTEAVVDFVFTGVYTGGSVLAGDRVIGLGQEGTAITPGPDSVSFRLPLALWGGQTAPRVFVASGRTMGTSDYDRVPDAGWLDVASGLAVLPRPGDPRVGVEWADPIQDATWPDLTGLAMRVVDGDLEFELTFAHGVERRDLQQVQDSLVIQLSFDVDRRLWTGFRNNHELPPTFGIDRQIQIHLTHLANGPDAVLRWPRRADASNPTAELLGELSGVRLGDPHFDTRCIVGANAEFGTAANQVLLRIPLGYFEHADAQMYVLVDAFLEATAAPGHADVLPDEGALDTRVGLTPAQRVRPRATCAEPERIEADLTDDSTWGGYHGDEIIQTRACPLTDGGLEVRVDLEQLEYSDMAFVNVFVDADGLLATGIPVVNNAPLHLGADFCVSCQFSRAPEPTIVSALFLDLRQTPFWPEPLRIAHLVSARAGGVFGSQTPGGCFVFNLPPEILGPLAGPEARYLVTTTRQAYSATDQTRYLEKLEEEEPPGVKRSGIIHITPTGRSEVVDSAPNAGFHTVTRPAPLPLGLLGLRPTRGDPGGGTPVTITGHGFAPDAEVRFGDRVVPALSTRFVSSGELVVVSPPGAPGAVPVSVRHPGTGENAGVPGAFTYAAPVVLAPRVIEVEPSLGPLAGGNTVEIRGANFVEGLGVRIGGQPVLFTRRESPFRLAVGVPPGSIGPATVEVTHPDGATGALAEGYNYGARPPEVWTVVPRFGPVTGGTGLTIVGRGFEPGAVVRLGGSALSSGRVESDQVITGVAPPAGGPGFVDLSVTHPNGVRRSVPGVFEYGRSDPPWSAPSILGVTPMSSPTEGGVGVSLLGTGFVSGAAVFFDRTPAFITYFDGNLIEAIAPPHASGVVAVRVLNPDGQAAELPADQGWNSFTYDSNEPTLFLVNPMSSPTTGGEEITLFGGNFRPGARVEFGGVPAVAVDVGETVIFAVTPPHAPGPIAIRVTNPGGLSALYEGDLIFGRFEYVGPVPGAPRVNRCVPAEGSVLGGEEVRIEGGNLYAGVQVFFAGNEATRIRQSMPDSITVRLPAGGPGVVDLEVRNVDGRTVTLPSAFRYGSPVPAIEALTPGQGPATGGTVIELKGARFLPDAEVTVAGLPAGLVRWIDPGTLQAVTPPGIPGAATVQVTNPGGVSCVGTAQFTYEGESAPGPQIEGVEPARGDVAGGNQVTVLGNGFLAGATVRFGTETLTGVDVHSTRRLTGIVPPGLAGWVEVEVRNRDDQAAAKLDGYVYIDPGAPLPEVHSVMPDSGPAAGGTRVVIRGAGFQPGARGFFGVQGLAGWEWVGPGQLEGETPPGEPGTVALRVINPDGLSAVLPAAFTYAGGLVRPRFRAVALEGGELVLGVGDLEANRRYALEGRERVDRGEWQRCQEFQADGSEATLRQPLEVPSAAGFYRVRVVD